MDNLVATFSVDAVKFIRSQTAIINAAYDNCYPGGYLEEDECHANLQRILVAFKAINSFLDAIAVKPQ